MCPLTAKYRRSIAKLKSASAETVIPTVILTYFLLSFARLSTECRNSDDRLSLETTLVNMTQIHKVEHEGSYQG